MRLNKITDSLCVVLSMIFLLILPILALAEDFSVNNTEDLREALLISGSNDEDDFITIQPGTYNTGGEPFSYKPQELEVFPITIEGVGSGVSVLQGDGASEVLLIETSELAFPDNVKIAIRNLTITGGGNSGIETVRSGGPGANDIIVADCEIINNTSSLFGAGASLGARNVSLVNNTFKNNKVQNADGVIPSDANGGGVHIDATDVVFLSNNTFEGNSTPVFGGGAAITLDFNGDATLLENTFTQNISGSGGGGVSIGDNVNTILNENLIIDNTSMQGGGALVSATSDVNLNANEISNNSADPGDGGGILIRAGLSSIFTNNIILNNSAFLDGGGILVTSPQTNLTNNTISSNSALANGGGLSVTDESENTTNIYNNIVVFNDAAGGIGDDIFVNDDPNQDNVGSSVNLFNNDFFDFASLCEDTPGCFPDLRKEENISADPQFVDEATGNVELSAASPAIDAGDPNAPDLPETDFFGNPRLIGSAPDLGAIEFSGSNVGTGGGCSIADRNMPSSIPVYLCIPLIVLMRILWRRHDNSTRIV